jgi:8-oxo-dGTP pyrophosphatase MutT (NUDIX family)
MPSDTRFTARVAVHLFLNCDRNVLLLRRANTGYEDGNYSVPAGHLDGGEEVVAAAIREAHEEIGIVLAPSAASIVGVMHRRSDVESIDFFLVASTWTGEIINAEPHKCDELAWYPLDALPANTIPYVRRALDNYRRGIWFDSYGWEHQGMSDTPQ